MSTARDWDEVRAGMLARGQVTEGGIADARAEQDAAEAGYHLAQLRKRAGMTQKDVAAALHVSQARVSDLENGSLEQLTIASARRYLAAIGGSIRLVATVADTEVSLHIPAGT